MAASKTKTSRIHFVTGSEESEVKKAAAALAETLAPGADAFGMEIVDGAVDTVDPSVNAVHQTIQALLTLPFLGGAKLVWLKNATFLGDTTAGRSESVTGALEELCKTLESGLPEGVTFLLSAPESDKRRSAYKTLSKLSSVTVHDKPDLGFRAGEEEIIAWTAERAHTKGMKIAHDAVETLAARVGLESRQLDNELSKLELAFGEAHSITAADVRMLVPSTRESGIFELGTAIQSRDLPLALEMLQQLFKQGERGVGILLASIVPTVRNLLLVKDLLVRHKLPPPAQAHYFAGTLKRLSDAALSHLPRKKDGTLNAYPLGIAAMNCSHYTIDELRAAFSACATANHRLVTSQAAEDVVLGRLLIGFMKKGA